MAWGKRTFNAEEAKKKAEENSFGVLPEGEYEAFITKVNPEAVAKNTGAKGIEFHFTIRDDVDQAGKKRKIFDTIWMENADGSESGAAPRLDVLGSRLGLPTGADIGPDTVEELFYGKPIRLELEINEYNGKENNRVKMYGFKAATVGGRYSAPADSNPTLDDPFAGNEGSIDIQDSDLPF